MEELEDILERIFPWWVAAAALAMALAMGLVYFHAPIEQSMGVVQKIFYSHVPAAMAAYAGFTVTSVASLLYLLRPHPRWDIAAVSGAHVGLLFCLYVLVSGPLWAYKAWGTAWTWEPQLTATFVLFLLYGGYVLLRWLSSLAGSRVGGGERIRQISAVLAVIAFVDIPIIHYAVRQWGGMHPSVERQSGGGLAPAMKTTFSTSMIGFLLLFGTILWLSIRNRRLQHRIQKLRVDLEDLRRLRQ